MQQTKLSHKTPSQHREKDIVYAIVFKKHWRWTPLKAEGKKILIYLQAPDRKYTASIHSGGLPHTTALFHKPLNLTWSNHILGGRERIQLP